MDIVYFRNICINTLHKGDNDDDDDNDNNNNNNNNHPRLCFLLQLMCFKPLNAELNPICHLLALLRAHRILYVRRIRV
jgi:hypothetical protein